MRKFNAAVLLALGSFIFTSCASWDEQGSQGTSSTVSSTDAAATGTQNAASPEVVNRFAGSWPEASKKAAGEMIQKYGEPTESTPNMLIWRDALPFKRIIVYKEETLHKFPLLHKDVVEHVVDYRVPTSKVGDLNRFDGSVYVDRTRGELSSRSDSEAMNFVALNLAHEVLSGERSYKRARLEYGKQAMENLNGNTNPIAESLQFGRQINTADADQNITGGINWMQAEQEKPASSNKRSNNKSLKQAQEEMAE